MSPKFSIGEVVILQSPRFSKYNGEYTVFKIWSDPKQIFTCRLTGTPLRVSLADTFAYHFKKALGDDQGREICFAESSLKKRQERGDLSFNKLMNTLKCPETEASK